MAEVTRKLLNSYRGWLPRCLERKPLVVLERGGVFGGILFAPMQVRCKAMTKKGWLPSPALSLPAYSPWDEFPLPYVNCSTTTRKWKK